MKKYILIFFTISSCFASEEQKKNTGMSTTKKIFIGGGLILGGGALIFASPFILSTSAVTAVTSSSIASAKALMAAKAASMAIPVASAATATIPGSFALGTTSAISAAQALQYGAYAGAIVVEGCRIKTEIDNQKINAVRLAEEKDQHEHNRKIRELEQKNAIKKFRLESQKLELQEKIIQSRMALRECLFRNTNKPKDLFGFPDCCNEQARVFSALAGFQKLDKIRKDFEEFTKKD
jgi:hypothetical protein